MAFLEDQEDVVSMSLTVVHSLMDKYDIQPASIGRQGRNHSSEVNEARHRIALSMSVQELR